MGDQNTQDQRRTPRYNLKSIKAYYGDSPCELIDVSPTGMLLMCDDVRSLQRGDVITIQLSVPLMQHIVPINVDGFVIHNNERGLAVDYAEPTQAWRHVLRVIDAKEHKTTP